MKRLRSEETSRGNCNTHSRVRSTGLVRGFGLHFPKQNGTFIGSFFSKTRLFYSLYSFFLISMRKHQTPTVIYSFFLLFPLQPNNNKESLCVTQSASMLAGSCAFPAEVRSGYASFLSGSVPRSPWGTGGGRGEAGGKGVQPARPPHDTLAGTW